jgi:glycosyltransferase involved in cell wall biosynthesis
MVMDPQKPPSVFDLSLIIPCLNEAETLPDCIERAARAFTSYQLRGEILVVDNGSTDASAVVAARLGATVLHVPSRGYGNAVAAGCAAARGQYLVVGDADGSYDFLEIPRFVDKLGEGYDLVQGCRLPSGGGVIGSGAMPFLHLWWGNPMFSWLARRLFSTTVSDIHCGLKAFTRALYRDLDLRCEGFEFNCELLVEASRRKARIAELPITLHRDRRRSHPPHLHTFRDGVRHLWFFLFYDRR